MRNKMGKLKKKENIIKLILTINIISMLIGISLFLIKQDSMNSPHCFWILFVILLVLNIILIIKTNKNNVKRNLLLMISLIVLNIVTPMFYNVTYQKYKEERIDQNNKTWVELRADGGFYEIEHFSNIFGIDFLKIEHKPNKNVKDIK